MRVVYGLALGAAGSGVASFPPPAGAGANVARLWRSVGGSLRRRPPCGAKLATVQPGELRIQECAGLVGRFCHPFLAGGDRDGYPGRAANTAIHRTAPAAAGSDGAALGDGHVVVRGAELKVHATCD